jgi:flagellar hook-length control protein FliK
MNSSSLSEANPTLPNRKLKKQGESDFDAAMMQMGMISQMQEKPSQLNLSVSPIGAKTPEESSNGANSKLVSVDLKGGELKTTSQEELLKGLELTSKLDKSTDSQKTEALFAGPKQLNPKSLSSKQQGKPAQEELKNFDPLMQAVQNPILSFSKVNGGKGSLNAGGGVSQENSLNELPFSPGNNPMSQSLELSAPQSYSFSMTDEAQSLGEKNKSADLLGASKLAKKPVQNHLSGSEFLMTLSNIRGGMEGQNAQSNLGDSHSQGGFQNKPQGVGIKKDKLELTETSSREKQAKLNRTEFNDLVGNSGGFLSNTSPTKMMTEISAPVVPGANAQNRLSTEALMGISGGIRNLSPSGGGEIRIRLKPENLGELHIRVTTHGGKVGLQIQASDEKAKKVIEDSIGYLRESLSAQNLILNQVDFSTSASSNQMSGNDSGNDPRHSQSNLGHQNDFGQNLNHGGQQRQPEHRYESESGFEPVTLKVRSGVGLATSSQLSSGRLDVQA